jgi:hypothetical protein
MDRLLISRSGVKRVDRQLNLLTVAVERSGEELKATGETEKRIL